MCLAPRNRTQKFIYLVLTVILLVGPGNVWAGEITVQNVAQGSATITQEQNNTFIQADNNTIINYTQFDVDLGERATFIQPDSASRVLNRVISADPSYLLGTITANGQVYFVNQSGVVIGADAVINAASFYAAAGNISDTDFLAGTDRFTSSGGVLTNEGTINAPDGVALIGSKVLNSGTIISEHGLVALYAGSEVYLAESGSGVKIRVDNLDATTGQGATASGETSSEAGVENEGTVNGGEVLFSCGDVYSLAVFNTGRVTARGGKVTMSGNGLVQNEGQIDVSDSRDGGTGGTVKMLGETVVLDDAEIDASGNAGGGTVLIGGAYQGAGEERNSSLTFVDAESSVKADALSTGNGGQIIVWSDGTTGFYGDISGQGSEFGKGGFAEVSGVEHLGFNGGVNLLGGAGAGTLLLDPTDIIVDDAGAASYSDVSTFTAGGATETISSATLDGVGGNVALQAKNDITVNDPLTLNTVDADLAMRAGNDITIDAAVTTSDGKITMTANDPGGTQSGSGSLFVNANLSTTGNAEDGDSITLNVSGGTGSVQLDAVLDAGVGTLSGDAETVYIMSSAASIQDGISIVNNDGTVYVVGGDTYAENISITKPLSLLGKKSDGTTDAWTASTVGADGDAPVIQHNPDPVITVNSNDVTIRGIEVDVTVGDAQKGISVTSGNNLTVEYCSFSYDNTDDGDFAISFNPTIESTVFNAETISWNDFDTTAGTDSWAIVMGNATNLEISNNTFDTGIKFDIGGGGSSSSDLLVTSNTFNDFASPGILFIRDGSGAISSGLEITQNDFNSRSIGIYFFATGDAGAADFDDSLQAGNFGDPVVIDENKFHNFGAGTEIALQVCDESNPVSLAIQIDARNNFWDSVNGPTETDNKLNVGSQGAEISDNSDDDAILVYAPWWSALTNDVVGAYAGTVLSPVYNVQLDTAYATFALALAAASTGDELQATPGPYSEAVNINKDVTVTVTQTGLTGDENWATATSWASPALTSIGLGGNFATGGGNFSFLGDVELTGDTMFDSAGGTLSFTTLSGNYNLTLAEGIAAGTTTFTGDVSNLGSGVGAALSIEENVTGLVNFQGELGTNSGISAVDENVAIQVDKDVALGNGDTATVINGELTIGADCTSFSSYDGLTVDELSVTAGANSFTLTSNDGNASFASAIDFSGRDLSINSTTGSTTFQGAISNLGDGTGAALTVGAGTTGLVKFESTLGANSGVSTANGTSVQFEDDVTISGGDTASFLLGSIGLYGITFTTDGALTIGSDSTNVVFLSDAASQVLVDNQNVIIGATVYGAQEFTVNAGTGTIQANGPIGDFTALLDLTLIGSAITTGSIVTVDDSVAMTASTGDISLGNSITAGGEVALSAAAGAIIQGAGTVTGGSLDLDSANGILGPTLSGPIGMDNQIFLASAAEIDADVSGPSNINIKNSYDGVVTVNSLTTNGGYIAFANSDELDLLIAGGISSGTAGLTNGGIIAITSGGAITVNGLIDSRAGSGGNLVVGNSVTLNTAPQVGAGHILIAGDTEESLTLNLPVNEVSEIITRPDVAQAPIERAANMAERFRAADRNDDGFLSYQEFLGLLAIPSTSGARRLFQTIDLNSDAMLSLEELESYIRSRRGRSASASGPAGDVRMASIAGY